MLGNTLLAMNKFGEAAKVLGLWLRRANGRHADSGVGVGADIEPRRAAVERDLEFGQAGRFPDDWPDGIDGNDRMPDQTGVPVAPGDDAVGVGDGRGVGQADVGGVGRREIVRGRKGLRAARVEHDALRSGGGAPGVAAVGADVGGEIEVALSQAVSTKV